MKKPITLLTVGALVLALTSCSGSEVTSPDTTAAAAQTNWASPEEKLETFMVHVCQRDGHDLDVGPGMWATADAIDVLADPGSSTEDKMIALDITTRPADAYEQDLAFADSPKNMPRNSVPRTLTPDVPGTCSGWVWEKHLEKAHDREYDDFTFEKARTERLI